MEDIIDIIVTETTNLIEITSQPTDEIIDVNIIDNREDITFNVTPTVVEININSLTGNFGVNWGDITGTISNQTDLNTALSLKADLVDGKVPSSQLPSYVDDVVEVANYASLPATGEVGKIYITLDTNFIYRWTGSVYVEIKDSSAVWGAITGTLSNQTDLQNALNAKANDNAVVHLAGTETITGAKTFSSAVTAPNFVLSGGTGNTGLYYGHTDRVVLANYTAGGIDFEVNGGAIVATLFPSGNYGLGITLDAGYKLDVNGTARISGALSGTSASFSSSVTASSIIKSGGTSSQFLKADGSVDSNSYLNTAGGTMTGVLFATSASFSGFVGFGGNTSPLAAIDVTGAGRFSSSVTASSLIKSGGTSSQFLKADGSVDSSTYLTTGTASSTYVALTGDQTIAGVKTFSNRIVVDTDLVTNNVMFLKNANSNGYGLSIQAGFGTNYALYVANNVGAKAFEVLANGTTNVMGALNGTSSVFSSSITASALYVTGMTAGSGAIYHTGSRLTFANYNTSGTLHFEVNGGTGALTLNADTSATFTGQINSITGVFGTKGGGSYGVLISDNDQSNVRLKFTNTGSGGRSYSIVGGLPGANNSSFAIYDETAGSTRFNISDTGAATFSSSVSAVNFSASSSATEQTGINGGNITFYNAAASNKWIKVADDGSTINAIGFSKSGSTATVWFPNGNVGIGTTSPNRKLQINVTPVPGEDDGVNVYNGTTNFLFTRTASTYTYKGVAPLSGMIYCENNITLLSDGGNITFNNSGSERMRITSAGNVLIGTTSTLGFALEVNGSIWTQKLRVNDGASGYVTLEMENSSRWRINYLGRFSGYGAGTLTTDSSGNISASSDRTLKDVIKPIENVLENIKDFEPVYFKWNNKTDLDKENVYMSTIAQSIQKHYPDAVGKMADGTLTVQDRAVTAILVQAIKELTEKVKTLENK